MKMDFGKQTEINFWSDPSDIVFTVILLHDRQWVLYASGITHYIAGLWRHARSNTVWAVIGGRSWPVGRHGGLSHSQSVSGMVY